MRGDPKPGGPGAAASCADLLDGVEVSGAGDSDLDALNLPRQRDPVGKKARTAFRPWLLPRPRLAAPDTAAPRSRAEPDAP